MKKGFTLIELMIVIAICGIITSIVVGQYRARHDIGNRHTQQTK